MMKNKLFSPEMEVRLAALFSSERGANYDLGATSQAEVRLLLQVFAETRPAVSAEWGLGSGKSAVALGSLRRELGLPGRHIALDPFQTVRDGQGIECLKRFAAEDLVDFRPLSSEEFLLNARKRADRLDFVFIDGAHDLGHKLMDACLVMDVLAPNGIVCFHDSFFSSTATAIQFLMRDHGMKLIDLEGEPRWKRRLRGAKHLRRLGPSFAWHAAPYINRSFSVLTR